jgi:hypothetical protein
MDGIGPRTALEIARNDDGRRYEAESREFAER